MHGGKTVESRPGWKPALHDAGMLRRLSRRRLRGEGLSTRIYAPGDTIIVETRQAIRAGEVILAEIGGRDALYRHVPGAAVVRFEAGDTAPPIQIPASDLRVVGAVIGLCRERTVPLTP